MRQELQMKDMALAHVLAQGELSARLAAAELRAVRAELEAAHARAGGPKPAAAAPSIPYVALNPDLGSRERHRREPGRVPDAAEGAGKPDAQPDADGRCVTWRPDAVASKLSPRHGTEARSCGIQPKRVASLRQAVPTWKSAPIAAGLGRSLCTAQRS